jgi:hypothetical protein
MVDALVEDKRFIMPPPRVDVGKAGKRDTIGSVGTSLTVIVCFCDFDSAVM